MILILFISISSRGFSVENKYITGKARVIDGDTIVLNKNNIRLHGIDAPELNQICYDKNKIKYNCGKNSKQKLLNLLKYSDKVKCFYSNRDRYKRILGTCFINKINLNSYMVLNGYAIAYKKFSNKYVIQENFAKSNKKGLWQGNFIKPEEWRRKNK